jgi:phosphoribosylformylglycinamidine synthase
MKVDLNLVPADHVDQNDVILFSESAGRFIVTINPKEKETFEKIFNGLPYAYIGTISEKSDLVINGIDNRTIISIPVQDLKAAWKKPFGELI